MIRKGEKPLYRQLYQTLKGDILSGKYETGAHLPPERRLCELYGLDRTTVRRCLGLLSDEGIIERRQGLGTIVAYDGNGAVDAPIGNVLFALCRNASLGDRIAEPFYTHTIDALEQRLHNTGSRLIYSALHPDDDIKELAERIEARAIIAAGAISPRISAGLRALEMPAVVYNALEHELPCIVVDNSGGAMAVARRLLALGHSHIGIIDVPGYMNSSQRLSGFRAAWDEAGVSRSLLEIETGDWTEQSGKQAATKLLHMGVTAIFGGNDSMAIGAIQAAHEVSLRVPDDISIVGFDDIERAANSTPPLASVRSDISMMIEATYMVTAHMLKTGRAIPVNVTIPCSFIERASVGSARL